jgi:hypothetical protein
VILPLELGELAECGENEMELSLPEGEEILDLLLAGGGANVLDVNGVGRHDGGEGIEVWCVSV